MSSPPPYQSYGAPPQDTGKGPMGLEPNMFGMLCYAPCCIGLIVSIIGVAMEKNNRFIRFHAFQGLFLNIILIIIGIIISVVAGFLAVGAAVATQGAGSNAAGMGASFIIQIVVWGYRLLVFILLIFMMIKAYGGATTKLPVIGDLAEKQAG
jgi:uncharacterized membrane protein